MILGWIESLRSQDQESERCELQQDHMRGDMKLWSFLFSLSRTKFIAILLHQKIDMEGYI